jgi:hypothetical protein
LNAFASKNKGSYFMGNKRPDPSEYNPRYSRYIDLVPENNVCAALEQQLDDTVKLFSQVPDSMIEFRYAPGKWTIREVLGHILDTDRIFGFRLLTFARGDSNPLAVADQDLYIRNGGFAAHSMEEWIDEFSLIRRSNIALVRHLPAEAWARTGTVSGNPISVRALAYFMVGHERHHVGIIRNMYLSSGR